MAAPSPLPPPSPPAASRRSSGLTLLELLVVMLLVALLGTLLMQGTGFFLGRFETLQRVHRTASAATLEQQWFASSVQGMVALRQEERQFRGDASAFSGISTAPLAAEPGMPVTARWFIERDGALHRVRYTEDAGTGTGADTAAHALPWSLHAAAQPLVFQYADASGRWQDRWPPPDAAERVPHLVRLVRRAQTLHTVWLARPALFPQPVQNYREF